GSSPWNRERPPETFWRFKPKASRADEPLEQVAVKGQQHVEASLLGLCDDHAIVQVPVEGTQLRCSAANDRIGFLCVRYCKEDLAPAGGPSPPRGISDPLRLPPHGGRRPQRGRRIQE